MRRMVDVLASGRAREPVRPGTIDWTDRGNEAPGAPWLVKSRPRNRNWGRGLGFSLGKYSVNPYLIEHNLISINQLWRRSISALWMMVRRNRKEINELRLEATG